MRGAGRARSRVRGLAGAALLGAALALAGTASAQTDPGLALEPWPDEGSRLESRGELRLFEASDVGDGPAQLELVGYGASGRFRAAAGAREPAIGYALEGFDLDTADGALPPRLLDASAALGVRVGEWKGWRLAATAGGGFAGDTPFSDADAWYGKASFTATRRIDKKRSWRLGLSFDGNRVIFPDVPLPMVAYRERVGPELSYVLGVPFSSATWRPFDRLTLTARTAAFVTGEVEARYRVAEPVDLFAGYDSETSAYHREGGDEHRRLLYERSRVEAGLRYEPSAASRLELGGGYAFDRRFERGFDVRDTALVREVDDAPYLRFALELSF